MIVVVCLLTKLQALRDQNVPQGIVECDRTEESHFWMNCDTPVTFRAVRDSGFVNLAGATFHNTNPTGAGARFVICL